MSEAQCGMLWVMVADLLDPSSCNVHGQSSSRWLYCVGTFSKIFTQSCSVSFIYTW